MKLLTKTQCLILCFCCVLSGCSAKEGNTGVNANVPAVADVTTPPEVTKSKSIDLAGYFQGMDGTMVIYDSSSKEYSVYNTELSEKRASPCSTFKIVSAWIGLNENIIKPEDSTMIWNGVNYPVEQWNKNLTLKEAFQSSCIWYFRNIIDTAGQETVNKALRDLSYGNCDTSQWEGSNTNQGYAELNGFWLESSLLISPKEQVDVLVKLFSEESNIKEIMQVDNTDNSFAVYGKTGTGTKDGNAWFVGFAEKTDSTYYFALRLDNPENGNASGQRAKEIALEIINGW